MSKRVAVFVDYQNAYRSARRAYADRWAGHPEGQFHPSKLGDLLAARRSVHEPSELSTVRLYRGQPDGRKDSKGYAASSRQIAHWRRHDVVEVFPRPLRYPRGWPHSHEPTEKPQEKGVDVLLAIDMVMMAMKKDYDVAILMSGDTDLKPAIEAVIEILGEGACEVAAWQPPSGYAQRLSVDGKKVYCHYLTKADYDFLSDPTDYNVG